MASSFLIVAKNAKSTFRFQFQPFLVTLIFDFFSIIKYFFETFDFYPYLWSKMRKKRFCRSFRFAVKKAKINAWKIRKLLVLQKKFLFFAENRYSTLIDSGPNKRTGLLKSIWLFWTLHQSSGNKHYPSFTTQTHEMRLGPKLAKN